LIGLTRPGSPGPTIHPFACSSFPGSPLPLRAKYGIHFSEEGIQSFKTALKMRQIIAYQHWLGNTSYSMHDIIQEMMQRMK
jgi:hypothetical protein